MKVSIAWIFDHIDADWRTVDIEALVKTFNQTTAEIEGWYAINTDLKNLFVGKAISNAVCTITDLKKEVTLTSRTDVQKGHYYLIKKTGSSFAWATSIDLGAHKQMMLPAVAHRAWKKSFESRDYILDIDNKSITHRPDLWGARGFAREIAAILDLKLKPYDTFLARKHIKNFKDKAPGVAGGPPIAIDDSDECRRFAGLYIPKVSHAPSLIWMVARLSRVDARSIDALVDFTNYVMLDTSQPMHVFDASKITDTVSARHAKSKEKLELLDDQKLELCKHDIVIADTKGALSLAGIMGGKFSGVDANTQSLFLESANFAPATIRRSSQRYHVRSEASSRFEKSLDPMQNVQAILRFLKLMDDADIAYDDAPYIASVGKTYKAPTVAISHALIEKRIGVPLKNSFIKKTLEKIGFTVTSKEKKSDTRYHIIVPLYRATKDIGLAQDIIEEVVRFYGYQNIPFVLPERKTEPTDIKAIECISRIKHQLAFGLHMRELYSYSFFDESFMRTFGWDPRKALEVKDPVSQNWYRLVTTLMPQMLKAVHDNCNNNDDLSFFELGRTWHNDKQIIEFKKLAGIFYHKKSELSFYDYKAKLTHLFAMLKMSVEFKSPKSTYPWMSSSHTAEIIHNKKSIGIAGLVDAQFMKPIAEGNAFIFELDAGIIQEHQAPVPRFKPLAKYPAIERDISMLVPTQLTVAQLTQLISHASDMIRSVQLVDFFTKKEWRDKKSLTFRYIIRDDNATLTGAHADAISDAVLKVVTKAGAVVR